jgi:hypothetical protein
MAKRIMIVGLRAGLVDEFQQQLDLPDIELIVGTGVEDVRSAFAVADIDHVFLGGGLDLQTRLAAVAEVFQSSDQATVHMKDHLSGPEGFVPFVQAVLRGLGDYAPIPSERAVLRAHRADDVSEG